MKKQTFFALLLWIASIAWACLIFYFSGRSGEVSAAQSSRFMLPFAHLVAVLFGEAGHTVVRKCAHFFLYFMLMLLVSAAWRCSTAERPFAVPFTLCALYAVSDEIHQFYVPERACRLYDVGVDALGCVCAAVCIVLLHKAIVRIRAKKQKESREHA